MKLHKVAGVAGLVAASFGTAAGAQSLRNAGPPAELPPASYTGSQYVDSRGCVYVRAGLSGAVTWVPRVNRSREHLCGFTPTLGSGAATVGAPASRPEPRPSRPPELITLNPPTGAPTPAAAPEQVRTAATAAPAPAAPVASPRVIAQSAAPAPAPEPEPRRITRAEACEGRTGVQPGFVSARTGQPIDCGPGPGAAVRTAAAPTTTPSPAPAGGPSSGPLVPGGRYSRQEVCAAVAATGIAYINAATGRPVECGNAARTITASAPAPAPAPRPAPAPAAPTAAGTVLAPAPIPAAPSTRPSRCAVSPYLGDSRYPVRCGPQTESPSGLSRSRLVLGEQGEAIVPASAASTRSNPFAQPEPPLSNPVGAPIPAAPPPGYKRVWDDGRINPMRGLPVRTGT